MNPIPVRSRRLHTEISITSACAVVAVPSQLPESARITELLEAGASLPFAGLGWAGVTSGFGEGTYPVLISDTYDRADAIEIVFESPHIELLTEATMAIRGSEPISADSWRMLWREDADAALRKRIEDHQCQEARLREELMRSELPLMDPQTEAHARRAITTLEVQDVLVLTDVCDAGGTLIIDAAPGTWEVVAWEYDYPSLGTQVIRLGMYLV